MPTPRLLGAQQKYLVVRDGSPTLCQSMVVHPQQRFVWGTFRGTALIDHEEIFDCSDT